MDVRCTWSLCVQDDLLFSACTCVCRQQSPLDNSTFIVYNEYSMQRQRIIAVLLLELEDEKEQALL